MLNKPKFIYFDLDDTLLDHQKAQQAALNDVRVHFEIFGATKPQELSTTYGRVNSQQWLLYSQGDITKEQLQKNRFEQTLQELGLNSTYFAEIGSYYLQCYRHHWQWVDGAQAAFEAICKQYPVGVLTNGFTETQQMKFQQFNLYDKATQLIISEEIGALKPDPVIFKHATGLTGLSAKEILYVGDSYQSDVLGGTGFGWQVGWFTTDGESHPEEADFVFSDFEDLRSMLKI